MNKKSLMVPIKSLANDTDAALFGTSSEGLFTHSGTIKSGSYTLSFNELNSNHSDSFKPLLFEFGWEVARKVGGIYTVLTTKAAVTVREYGDRFAFVGPYFKETAQTEFESIRPSEFVQTILDRCWEKHGIKIVFGRWLVTTGYPRAFLIDIESSRHRLQEWKSDLFRDFQCDENHAETDLSVLFGYQSALFLAEVLEASPENRPLVAHFHEWNASVGLIVSKRWNLKVATLFTTHAILLARWLAAAKVDLYGKLEFINADQEAGTRKIYQRHWIEVGAARGADIFTTVSEITSFEATHLLGRTPDIITPNGLNVDRFTALHEFQNLHKSFKDKISQFIIGHFYGQYTFDLDKTLYFFTAGRREIENKGVDMFIESLAELNHLLKQENSDMTIVAFIIMPGNTNSYNVESIRGQSVRREINETCLKITNNIAERLFKSIMEGTLPEPENLLSTDDTVDIKRRVYSIQNQNSPPPIVTHNVIGDDEILNILRRCNLVNHKDDKVKVIYHPEYLNATSSVFPLDYHQFVRGCHLGVFPSYYEPWGYTPAECTLSGVPSISSNLTGFSNYVQRRVTNPSEHGIYIINRRSQSFFEAKSQLASVMWNYTQLSRRDRIQLRNKTERLSSMLSWDVLGKNYAKARNQALQKVFNCETSIPSFFDNQTFEGTFQ
jgi:glycogen(starch) synthase